MNAPIKVYWQPWCTSCLRIREYLSGRDIAYESINVLEDEDAMAELGRLGARSVPVVARGTEFVFAQSIPDVVAFLGLADSPGPDLSPQELVGRLDRILGAAARYVRQLPDSELETQLPNRPRTYRVLMHHIFRIPDAFLEMIGGATLTYEMLVVAPPDDMRTAVDIAAYGDDVRRRVLAWWDGRADGTCAENVPTYYGEQPLHAVLERTTWHSCQHARQLVSLLERQGIAPDEPLTPADLAGLPLPETVWDE